ncbi:MAG: AI-2E family transporter [Verrucomicrobiae bacterium]|nr:AI-2E family transporter [Verrucomicrobiae bacterium]
MNRMPGNQENSAKYPTPVQRKTLWSAITAVSIVTISAIAVGVVILTSWLLGYLNPILVPVAVAGIIAYLLDPVIGWFEKKGMKRRRAFYTVFMAFIGAAFLLAFLVIKPAVSEGRDFWQKYLTVQTDVAVEEGVPNTAKEAAATGELPKAVDEAAGASKSEAEATTNREKSAGSASEEPSWFSRTRLGKLAVEKLKWLDETIGDLPLVEQFKREDDSWDIEGLLGMAWQRVSGFAGEAAGFFGRGFSSATSFLGYLLGLFLVPVYLFFFLRESSTIANSWANYLPLRQSSFKEEVVQTLKEINQYLIAYFRGQMVVSIIDGVLVAVALTIMGLDYALLLGVFLAILGLIPYLGNVLVMVPAVLIAFAQYSDPSEQWSWLPQIWAYPLIVLGIFFILQQVNGLVTAPKIVGDSVGLHPLTVIFSMLFWSLLLGGLLGALLAVPLTASLKVLFRRYVWERRLEPAVEARFGGAGGSATEASAD